jgi:hypothetical protein
MPVTTETGDGNCFQEALDNLVAHESWMLVHGLVKHPQTGLYHWHAWNEYTERHELEYNGVKHTVELHICYDSSNGNSEKLMELPQPLYYNAGQIINVRRYTLEEALPHMRETMHMGPWHEEDTSDEYTGE